jgi:hypothetical protein
MPPTQDPWLRGARTLTRVMDHHHLDPIMGLCFPVVGDLVGGAMGCYLLALAWRRRVPRVTMARMVLNTAIDTGLGAIPLVGDLFDFYFKANTRNLALLERAQPRGRQQAWDTVVLLLSCLALLMAFLVPIILAGWALRALWLRA